MYFQRHANTIGLIGGAGFVTGWGIEQELGFALMAGVGALISGTLVARLFGESGVIGLVLAAFGALLATVIGALLVGGLMAFPHGSGMAVAAVAEILATDVVAGGRWVILMGVAHWVAYGDACAKHYSDFAKH